MGVLGERLKIYSVFGPQAGTVGVCHHGTHQDFPGAVQVVHVTLIAHSARFTSCHRAASFTPSPSLGFLRSQGSSVSSSACEGE